MDQVRAKEIMTRNMFGVEDAVRHFGVNLTRQQTAALSKIPWSEATLEQCRETHVLVAVFPLSIIEIRSKGKLFYNQSWYNKEPFANDRGDGSWQLVRKTAVDNSTNKTWQEQQALFASNEETQVSSPRGSLQKAAVIVSQVQYAPLVLLGRTLRSLNTKSCVSQLERRVGLATGVSGR
jgi:hypothetical protein